MIPAVVHVEPAGTITRAGGGSAPASICSHSSSAADSAPNVPSGVAPPGGITIARRSRRASAYAANGTSITERSRTIGTPLATIAPAFSIAHSLAGCGKTTAPDGTPSARACTIVAIAWFEPYAPIAQIRDAFAARAWPSHASSVRTLLPP